MKTKQPAKMTMDILKGIVDSQRQSASQPETQPSTDSQAADWLWEKMAEIYGEQWIRERGEFPSLIWKAALNKQTESDVKHAVAEVVNQAITWPPNLPKFIELCQGPQIDTDEAFNRMIDRTRCHGVAEWQTRQEVGFRCKQQLSESKARALFKTVLTRNIQNVRNGELIERDFNSVQLAPPKREARETLEQRNEKLDHEIAWMLKSGHRLIGPYKKRYLETQGDQDVT